MSEKIKHNLKIAGGYIGLIAAMGVLMWSPEFYLLVTSGARSGLQAVCAPGSAEVKKVSLREVILRSDYWNFQQVAVSGKLSYSPVRKTFYLRDGIFSLPLNVSDCRHLKDFEQGETLAAVKGTISGDANNPLLAVTELRQTVPAFFQVLFSAGNIGLVAIVVTLLIFGISRLLRWILVAIGLKKPAVPLSPEEAENRAAGRMFLGSIGAPILWLINPFFGAGVHIFNVVHNRSGLRSSKRKVAVASIVISAVGFAGMLTVSFAAGVLHDASKTWNFYAITQENAEPPALTGSELLEFAPYVNNDFYFSIHQPKGWVTNEKDLKTDGLLVFEGPEDGSFQEKPFRPKFNVSFVPIRAFGATDHADALARFRALAIKTAGITLLADERTLLAGGQLDALLLETTETAEEGYKRHVLAIVAAENDVLYIAGAAIPEEKWNDHYAQLIRESVATLNPWRATFAACLKGKGAVLYSAFDCPYCDTQKELFTEGIERLPYVECTRGIDDAGQTDICRNKNITGYPTWEFADGLQLVGVQTPKALSEKTKCELPQ